LCVIEPEILAPVNPDETPAYLVVSPESPAVVRKAGTLSERPELLTVHATPFAVKAVFKPTASFEARAVVRYAPGACAVVR